MTEPCYFGPRGRELFGLLHHGATADGDSPQVPRPAWLVCPPLLQDAIRSHRALWTLSRSLAGAGHDVMHFDWYGTGDSSGDLEDLTLAGMSRDLDAGMAALGRGASARPRVLALRSAALPVLAWVRQRGMPVDLVLWQPCLDGAGQVADWRAQQVDQLTVAGRYPYGAPAGADDDLMGFRLARAWLDSLAALDFRAWTLPEGSHLLVAAWQRDVVLDAWLERQRGAGIELDVLVFEDDEAPPVDAPRLFEAQLFPRQSVAALSSRMAGRAA